MKNCISIRPVKLSQLLFVVILFVLSSACTQENVRTTKITLTATIKITPSVTASATTPAPTIPPTGTTEPVKVLEVDPEDLSGETVQFWHIWSGEAGDVVEEMVQMFNESNQWGIEVKPVFKESLDHMYEDVNRAIEAGENPDIVTAYLHQAQTWDDEKELNDLNIYVDDLQWGLSSEEQEDFYPVFWEYDVWNGKRLGIPAQRSGMLLYYNVTWAADLGFEEEPATYEQFKEQTCAAAYANRLDEEPGNDGKGGWIVSTDHAAMLGWIYSNGGDILEPDVDASEEKVYNFDSSEIEETFTFLRSLYDEGCAWFPESQYTEKEFANRLGLFSTGSVTDIPFQKAAFKVTRNRDKWMVIPFPSSDGESTNDVYGPSFEIMNSNPERELAAWLFIKWIIAPEQQVKLIEKTGTYPLRESTLDYLEEYRSRHSQWAEALRMIRRAKTEPGFQSWSIVRWALSDAARQLFMYYFTVEEVPVLLEFLDKTAFELHVGPDVSGVYNTPTFTPSPSPTATITPTPSDTPTNTPSPSHTIVPTKTLTPTSTISPSPGAASKTPPR